jgi:hypothetical protein
MWSSARFGFKDEAVLYDDVPQPYAQHRVHYKMVESLLGYQIFPVAIWFATKVRFSPRLQ